MKIIFAIVLALAFMSAMAFRSKVDSPHVIPDQTAEQKCGTLKGEKAKCDVYKNDWVRQQNCVASNVYNLYFCRASHNLKDQGDCEQCTYEAQKDYLYCIIRNGWYYSSADLPAIQECNNDRADAFHQCEWSNYNCSPHNLADNP